MHRRTLILTGFTIAALAVVGCSGSDDASKPTSTTSTTQAPIGGNTLPPVVLTPQTTSTTVKVGTVVTFNMGDPGEGQYVAVSSDPAVFEVTSVGRTDGSATFNAGGKARSAGTATVSVSYRGAQNGVGAPTNFTITVTG